MLSRARETFDKVKKMQKKTKKELSNAKHTMEYVRQASSKRELELLSEMNLAKAKLQKEKTRVVELEKMLRKMDKITKINQMKLIAIGTHMGKKMYYTPSDNDLHSASLLPKI